MTRPGEHLAWGPKKCEPPKDYTLFVLETMRIWWKQDNEALFSHNSNLSQASLLSAFGLILPNENVCQLGALRWKCPRSSICKLKTGL